MTPILKAYIGDPVRNRFVHAGVKETHVFHLHLYEWHAVPEDETSPRIDAISVSPQTAHTIEPVLGGFDEIERHAEVRTTIGNKPVIFAESPQQLVGEPLQLGRPLRDAGGLPSLVLAFGIAFSAAGQTFVILTAGIDLSNGASGRSAIASRKRPFESADAERFAAACRRIGRAFVLRFEGWPRRKLARGHPTHGESRGMAQR